MAENNVKEFNDSTFAEGVASGISLVDFWAPWCGPCQMQTPIIEDVASRVDSSAIVAKVNVDEAPQTAARFQIRSIPTIVVLKDGELVKQFAGVQSAETLLDALSEIGVGQEQ
ncbi:MAG: thioredoxin [Verrucomicrobiota bacterium]